jgi:hypothetical protein
MRRRLCLIFLLASLLPASALAGTPTHTYSAVDRTHHISYVLSGSRVTVTLSKDTPAATSNAMASTLLLDITCTAKAGKPVTSPGGWVSAPSSSFASLSWHHKQSRGSVTLRGWKGVPANCDIATNTGKTLSSATFH